ncbi:MAG: ABC transporter permease subunit [bacterium]
MIPIILRTIRDRWKMLLVITIIGVGTMLMYVSMFPTYQHMMEQNTQMFDQLPEAFKKAFNMEDFSFNTLEKFLNIEMYSLFWLVLTIILALSLASGSLAGEVERETIVQTVGQPVSRRTVYIARFLAAAKIFTVFNILVNASVFPFATMFHIPIQVMNFVTVGVMCELFGLAFLGLGFAVSAFMSDKGKTQMILAGVVLVMYVLNIVSGLRPSIEKLKYASLFHYFNPNTFLVKGEYDLTAILVFVGLAVVGFGVGLWRFTKRDVA